MTDNSFEWPKPRVRLTPAVRDHLAQELRRRYDEGSTVDDLSRLSGRSYGSVHRYLTDAGTTFRPRSAYPRPPQPLEGG